MVRGVPDASRALRCSDMQCVFEETHTSDQSIAIVSTIGKWSLTPWMRIGLQESVVAPWTKNPSKQASG